jgi:hypothetical protein
MDREKLRVALSRKTDCELQHDGWCCGTCFFAMSKRLTNKDWQALLLFRGDYTREEMDNLPKDIEKSLEKIYNIAIK